LIKKIPAFIFLITLLAATESFAVPMTLDECLQTALENNPDIIASESTAESKAEAVEQIKSENRFHVNAGITYSRSGSSGSSKGNYNTGIQVEKSLFDWGKRDLKTKAAKINADISQTNLKRTRESVIAAVKEAYYSLNRHVRRRDTFRTKHDNYSDRLEWARAYYEAGTKAKIEVTKAETDLAASKLALVQANSMIEQSKAELAAAMGTPEMEIEEVKDELAYDDWNIPLAEALKRAAADRPELEAVRLKERYAETALALQQKGLSPNVSASAGYSFGGSSFFEDDGWSARVSMNLPIYDGGLTSSKTAAAKADLRTARAESESLRNSVELEVRKAWQSLQEAKESVAASAQAERFARETLELARGRYKAGVADSLEISDAVNGYASAAADMTSALYKCKQARLSLERAMGGLEI
jgi:outer membrane protein